MDRFAKAVFPKAIKTVRQELGLTQKSFAKRIGVSPSNACAWENGHLFPSAETLAAITSVYGIRKEFLEYGQGEIFDQSIKSKNFILKASDLCAESSVMLSGHDVAKQRLENLKWPIFKSGNALDVEPDDNLTIYIAGRRKNSRSFVANAKVAKVVECKDIKLGTTLMHDDKPPSKILILKHVSWFDKPVKMTEVLDKLTVAPENRKKWGQLVQRSCARLMTPDYDVILKTAY